jgi:hypothetical protein
MMKHFVCGFFLLFALEWLYAQPVKPDSFTCSISPTIEKYYYNDRGTTGEIEAGGSSPLVLYN